MAVRFSKCCNPVPGDEIVGFVTRGRGMSIHRTDCINMLHLSDVERARLIDAEWEDTSETEGGGNIWQSLRCTQTTDKDSLWISQKYLQKRK